MLCSVVSLCHRQCVAGSGTRTIMGCHHVTWDWDGMGLRWDRVERDGVMVSSMFHEMFPISLRLHVHVSVHVHVCVCVRVRVRVRVCMRVCAHVCDVVFLCLFVS